MNSLGIYFGSKIITITQTQAEKLINVIQIPLSTVSELGTEDKITEVNKIVGLINSELRKNRIEAKEMALVISGKDLISRNFELPESLSYKELVEGAVNFEAKKYIPFKTEELVTDFQVRLDKSVHKNLILFMAIKRDVIDKYNNLIKQLNIKILSLEYSAFSLFRLLKLANVKTAGVIGLVSVDFSEDDESNFVVFQNGFPLFSRDMTFSADAGFIAEKEERSKGFELLNKLSLELRVSFDFYQRKFPTKTIEKIYFLAPDEYQKDLEAIIEERGFSAKFIDPRKQMGKTVTYSSGLFKAYSIALVKKLKCDVKINLLKVNRKVFNVTPNALSLLNNLKSGIKLNPVLILLALAIILASFGLTINKKMSLEKELSIILNNRIQVSGINKDASYDEIADFQSKENQRLKSYAALINKRFTLTDKLNLVAQLTPANMWLTGLSFRQDDNNAEIIIKGYVYLGDSEKEVQLINSFLKELKRNILMVGFKKIQIDSLDYSKVEQEQEITASKFSIRAAN